MPYLLDTDIYIYLTAGNKKVLGKIQEAGDENIFLSSISVAELYFGIFGSKQMEDNLRKIQNHLKKLEVMNFTKNTAKVFGRIKADLKRKGTPVADMDLAIASIAIHNNLTLVTHNTRHFEPVGELL